MVKQAVDVLDIDDLAPSLVHYLSKRVANNEDANDLAQEALLRTHSFVQKNKIENTKAYLYKTANNLLIDQLRRAQVHDNFLTLERHNEINNGGPDHHVPSLERTVSAEQDLANVNRALLQLPKKVAQAFLMSRGKDMSYSEIAAEMSVSVSMVEKYIVQALKALRKEVL